MKNKVVTIIDYGIGNILSLQRSFEYIGAEVVLTADTEEIYKADYIVLPGVGSFPNAMSELNRLNLVNPITEIAKKGVPLLGICLGMQLLCDSSKEHGITKGLGVISGNVIRIPNKSVGEGCLKIPQIGWNELFLNDGINRTKTILKGLSEKNAFYFVHSFMLAIEDDKYLLAYCHYGDNKITAVIQNNNIMGCQFHPEKSGEAGLRILKNFLKY